jgi:nicotinamidase-related amidase
MKLDRLKLKKDNTALLVVDAQKDFFTKDDEEELKPLYEMAHILKKTIVNFRHLEIPIIFTKYIERKGQIPKNITEKKLDGSCVEGSGGEAFYGFEPTKEELIIEKNTWDAFSNPNLDDFLKRNKIKNLIVAGVDTEVCVFSTISSAFAHGYTVIAPHSLIGTEKSKTDMHQMILKIVDQYYGYVVDIEELIKRLES